MRHFLSAAALLCAVLPLAGDVTALPSLSEPSLAPDRPEVAFISGGDIWTAPLAGGEAHLLVSDPATESRPIYSPDGKRLAFMSTRSGNSDIYVLDLATSQITRITYDDASEHLDAWSHDGKYLYFSSSSQDISGNNDILRVSAEGGTPMPVTADRYASEYWAAPTPDGSTLAFTAKGMPANQWWRHGHAHIDQSEIWTVRTGAKPVYEKISAGESKELWPMWSPDARRLYFVSDRDGSENLYVKDAAPNSRPRKLTSFANGRLLWPTIAYDGSNIVFERDFGVWRYDLAKNKTSKIEITLRGSPAGPGTEHLSLNSQFRDLALAADGKKVAFIAHGEIFAASPKEGGSAARVTSNSANEFDPEWKPDSRRITYASDRDGTYHIYEYDFTNSAETRLTNSSAGDSLPRWSPDGKLLAFIRGGDKLMIYDPASKQERQLAQEFFGLPPDSPTLEWSHDSQWIAFDAPGARQFRSVMVVPAAGGTPRAISFLPNTNIGSIAWSPDGTYLLFGTSQRTEPGQVVRIDLVAKTPKFREDQFRDLFKDELPSRPRTAPSDKPAPEKPEPDKPNIDKPEADKPAAGKAATDKPEAASAKMPLKVNITFEGIRQRYHILPIGLDVDGFRISPDGKTLLLAATAAGQTNLYTYPLDELAKEPPVARQLTATPGRKSSPQWAPDNKEVFYLEGGRLQSMAVESRQAKPVAVTADMDVDFAREKMEVFAQAWRYLDDNFYDPNFNGADWKQVRATFEPQIAGARTSDEVRRLISLMVGELNASHLGISAAFGPSAPVTGKVGLRFDPAEYQSSGRLHIAEVIALSPADVAGIKSGSYLLAVDGEAIGPHTNLDELLNHKVGRRVSLTIANDAAGEGKLDVPLKPVGLGAEKNLVYRQWVESRRDYVHKLSDGRLGYVHMPDMGSNSLTQLYLDLDTENQARDGVVIDIRGNNGGFVNAYALDVLARRPYLNLTFRGQPAAPARTVLGQRALERPTILITNRESLSDAEDFTEGYRAMKLGKVVGEPTAGWIIYTGGTQLIDGSILRLPRIKVTTADGVNMERNPRPVDIQVERPMGQTYTGRDAELEAAVKELLAETSHK